MDYMPFERAAPASARAERRGSTLVMAIVAAMLFGALAMVNRVHAAVVPSSSTQNLVVPEKLAPADTANGDRDTGPGECESELAKHPSTR